MVRNIHRNGTQRHAPHPHHGRSGDRLEPNHDPARIKSGKISGTKDEHGEWHIEPCELHRVYPPIARTDAAPQHATSDDVELRLRATLAEARLADLKASLDDLRSQRDNWQTIAQRLAITDQRPNRQPSQTTQSLWSRLTGIWTPLLGGSPTHM